MDGQTLPAALHAAARRSSPRPLGSAVPAVALPVVRPVRLAGLGTAVPPHCLRQDEIEEVARRTLGPHFPDFERLAPSFRSSGIERRHSVVPLEWFAAPGGWADRMARYRDAAVELFVAAATAALEDAQLSAAQVDVVVTVSSTGIATPTLEAQAAQRLGLRRDVQRVPIFGLGCAGGASGLSIAQRLAAARPGSVVLLVTVETCSLAFRGERPSKADMVATILFGDGAAAACLTTAAEGPTVGPGAEYTWPDTLDIMGWNVHDEGLGVIFDRSIPEFVRCHFRAGLESALATLGLSLDAVARPVCHPGGAKVLRAIETALELRPGALHHERTVLRDFGNMSSPTVLFVLQRVLADAPTGQMVATALGPGFTASVVPVGCDD